MNTNAWRTPGRLAVTLMAGLTMGLAAQAAGAAPAGTGPSASPGTASVAPGGAAPYVPAPRALSRAEVRADLALWQRARADEFDRHEGMPAVEAEQARRVAQYQRWRQGPEFLAEVRAQEARLMTAGHSDPAQARAQ
jgi:hypothetical protein